MAQILPIIITRGIIAFPQSTLVIEVGRAKTIAAIRAVNADPAREILVVSQKDPQVDVPSAKEIFSVGTLASVSILEEGKDGIKVEIKSLKRVKLTSIKESDYFTANYEELTSVIKDNQDVLEKVNFLLASFEDIYKKNTNINVVELKKIVASKEPNLAKVVYDLASASPLTHDKKQLLLEELDLSTLLTILIGELSSDKLSKKIDNDITKKVNENLTNQQKEFFLRERLKTIREELGDTKSKDSDVEDLKKQVKGKPYPELIKKRLLEEITRYESIPPTSQEGNLTKTYIDWLMNIPWWQTTVDNKDISKVKKVLDKNHYGLEKVKERIIEYLAVKTKANNLKGPILCLVGPPGVGKTSLAKSIADSLNKKFVKMSLGGVKEEAEIRGHRKTYLGAMPGRIIQGMKRAGVINPLFLLDEIDKMASDYRGDPASALLEVLDPEQNKIFSDNYIEEDFDLSKVMFLATANYYEQIPEALIDRMEIIELSSYTALEKLEIAKTHLVEKVLEESGTNAKEIQFDDAAISYVIASYTREAGVRELERKLSSIVRKFVVKNLQGKLKTLKVDVRAVKELLGKEIYEQTEKDKDSIAGVVNGMAYTSVGGDLLPIEVSIFPGKGNVIITGNLKETMKESANVALGYVRANADKFHIKHDVFTTMDFHIHVPQGGVPKDGPSAGVALTTALISAITKTKVSSKISMTGEITLRGRVLIIGGVKEKVISAHRAGVRTIYMPRSDERFLEDIPKEILKDISMHLVDTYDEVYSSIFKKAQA